MRRFKIRKTTGLRVKWLNRFTVYEGQVLSIAPPRVVRLFAPTPGDPQPHVDVAFDWLIPQRT